jgi:hypothetical protein
MARKTKNILEQPAGGEPSFSPKAGKTAAAESEPCRETGEALVLFTPARTRLRHQKKPKTGWRKSRFSVNVGPHTKWANPFLIYKFTHNCGLPKSVALKAAAKCFEMCLMGGHTPEDPTIREKMEVIKRDIRELRGRNLACRCELSKPCHADLLLALANPEARP